MVITWHVTNTTIPDPVRVEIKRYLFARQNPEDGGWGLHIEGESTVFGTAMTYVVLRILGANEEEKRMIKARGMLHSLGGAINGPHWAKFWLSVLGVMEWEAVNPVPPELWCVRPFWQNLCGSGAELSYKAFTRLGSNRTLAMVDSHASSLPSDVLRLLQTLRVLPHSFDAFAPRGAVHCTIFFHRLLCSSQLHLPTR